MEEIGIESTLVESIKNGEKTVEIRLGKPRFLRIHEGDTLSIREDFWYENKVLESLSHALEVKVTQVLYFESLKELFEAIDFQTVMPNESSRENAIKAVRTFYTAEDEREYGVIAFTIEVIRD